MKRMSKIILGTLLFLKASALLALIIILSVKKRSVPKAVYALFGAGSIGAAVLLTLGFRDLHYQRKIDELDEFGDYEYFTGNGECCCGCDEDFPEETVKIPEADE